MDEKRILKKLCNKDEKALEEIINLDYSRRSRESG